MNDFLVKKTRWLNYGQQFLKTFLFCCICCSLFMSFCLAKPAKLYGVYISRWTMYTPLRFKHIVDNALANGMNSLVCDYNGERGRPYTSNLEYAQSKGLYCIARVEVFPDSGADFSTFITANIQEKIKYAQQAQTLGFAEIQFDYIRFKDVGEPLFKKKLLVENFLKTAVASLNIPVQIDVFGSVAYHPHNIIGQDLNRIANIVSAVCPMLYPSHFYLDVKRMSQPYETMLEGCTLAKQQLAGRPVRLIPYIQGFDLKLGYAKMSLKDYIIAQIKATEDAQTDGFFVWNAGNAYGITWEALKEHPLNSEKVLGLF